MANENQDANLNAATGSLFEAQSPGAAGSSTHTHQDDTYCWVLPKENEIKINCTARFKAGIGACCALARDSRGRAVGMTYAKKECESKLILQIYCIYLGYKLSWRLLSEEKFKDCSYLIETPHTRAIQIYHQAGIGLGQLRDDVDFTFSDDDDGSCTTIIGEDDVYANMPQRVIDIWERERDYAVSMASTINSQLSASQDALFQWELNKIMIECSAQYHGVLAIARDLHGHILGVFYDRRKFSTQLVENLVFAAQRLARKLLEKYKPNKYNFTVKIYRTEMISGIENTCNLGSIDVGEKDEFVMLIGDEVTAQRLPQGIKDLIKKDNVCAGLIASIRKSQFPATQDTPHHWEPPQENEIKIECFTRYDGVFVIARDFHGDLLGILSDRELRVMSDYWMLSDPSEQLLYSLFLALELVIRLNDADKVKKHDITIEMQHDVVTSGIEGAGNARFVDVGKDEKFSMIIGDEVSAERLPQDIKDMIDEDKLHRGSNVRKGENQAFASQGDTSGSQCPDTSGSQSSDAGRSHVSDIGASDSSDSSTSHVSDAGPDAGHSNPLRPKSSNVRKGENQAFASQGDVRGSQCPDTSGSQDSDVGTSHVSTIGASHSP